VPVALIVRSIVGITVTVTVPRLTARSVAVLPVAEFTTATLASLVDHSKVLY